MSQMEQMWRDCLKESATKINKNILVNEMPEFAQKRYMSSINAVLNRVHTLGRRKTGLLSELFSRRIRSIADLTYVEAYSFVRMAYTDQLVKDINPLFLEWLKNDIL